MLLHPLRGRSGHRVRETVKHGVFFLFPVWPRVRTFPLITASLILALAFVFSITWPLEKRGRSVVGGDDERNLARDMVRVLSTESTLSEADRAQLRVAPAAADFPSPGLKNLFDRVEGNKSLLSSRTRYEWDNLYPVHRAFQQTRTARPEATSPFRSYGYFKNRPWPGILTHLFLHGGVAHLVFNLLFLWCFAGVLEPTVGKHVLTIFIGGGLGAAVAQVLWGIPPDVPMVGASGAISALMGFGLASMPHMKTKIFYVLAPFLSVKYGSFDAPLWFFLPLWVFQQVLMALLTRNNALVEVGYGAHLGGFVLGAAAGFTFRLFKPELCRATREESPW